MRCLNCKSKGLIGGSALTTYFCSICSKSNIHLNTAHPNICNSCSRDKNICEYCGESLTID